MPLTHPKGPGTPTSDLAFAPIFTLERDVPRLELAAGELRRRSPTRSCTTS